ncbi:AraC family transcriptional regulator [Ottowia sp.]|uniref:helix-turn-helix transcriptional regulator n=1 Tax=Ottowia sp. TaxID=1898956 RepID=UPI003A8B4FCE
MKATAEFVIQTALLPGLTLVAAHTRRCFARHSHAVHGIGVMAEGGQTSASDRGPVQAVQGEVITVNPGEVHDGVPMGGERRRWHMLYLDAGLLSTDGSGTDCGALEWTAPVLRDDRVAALCQALFASAARGADALAQEEWLAALLQHAPKTTALPAPVRAKAVMLALQRVRDQLADCAQVLPSLASLAREAGLSRYQLLRAFAAAYGLPPHAWALQQRVAVAEAQLAQGLSVAEVALNSGFADQSHMTRAFRRFRGYTPGQYARAHR